jgi:hypothetical protein
MPTDKHDPLHFSQQLRQALSADKLSIGFFLGAGCPCAVRVKSLNEKSTTPLIPDVKGLTAAISKTLNDDTAVCDSFDLLMKTFSDDEVEGPTIEDILNRIRSYREVAGKVGARGLSFAQLSLLDKRICAEVRSVATRDLPPRDTPYHSLASFIGNYRSAYIELFTTNYDLLLEQALETCRVPFFDGFIGSSRPFFDLRAIEDEEIPRRWSRLWKLHGSVNWRYSREKKAVFKSNSVDLGDELLIHPSHLKYDESRRMPYFVMVDRLKSFIRRGERPVALFIVGYSFGDEHINEIIVESLRSNSSAACFALQYGPLSNYLSTVSLACQTPNLSVIAHDGAVIRRKKGAWQADASADTGLLRGLFTIAESSAQTGQSDGKLSDKHFDNPVSATSNLGDFAALGALLDELAGYSSFSVGDT